MVEVLEYDRFFAQGGDFGSAVTVQLGINHADVVAAIHLNFFMGPPPSANSDKELLEYWGAVAALTEAESGYHHEQATKPQTIVINAAASTVPRAVEERSHRPTRLRESSRSAALAVKGRDAGSRARIRDNA